MTDDSPNDVPEDILEKRLASLNLARSSDTYLDKGVALIHAGQPAGGFWQRYLPVVLASALVISVTANVFQLVTYSRQTDTPNREQLALCNTPAVAATPVPTPMFEVATSDDSPDPTGMC